MTQLSLRFVDLLLLVYKVILVLRLLLGWLRDWRETQFW
jgi:hypothetical protein